MNPHRINRYLQTGEHLQPLVAKAQEIAALSKRCLELLPPELAPQVRGANIREDMLVIHAANPAAAAKLKLLAGMLGDTLRQQGSKVKGVSVRVQPATVRAASGAMHKRASLTPAALATLQVLRQGMTESPARRALGHLLERRAGGETQTTSSNRSPKSSSRKNTTRARAT